METIYIIKKRNKILFATPDKYMVDLYKEKVDPKVKIIEHYPCVDNAFIKDAISMAYGVYDENGKITDQNLYSEAQALFWENYV
jgi:hypothetical protein